MLSLLPALALWAFITSTHADSPNSMTNCVGSQECSRVHWAIPGMVSMLRALDNNDVWLPGQNILCTDEGNADRFCLFMQGSKVSNMSLITAASNGTAIPGIKGSQVAAYLNKLSAAGCQGCGSISLNALGGGNSTASLTVNNVKDTAGCHLICKRKWSYNDPANPMLAAPVQSALAAMATLNAGQSNSNTAQTVE